MEHIYVCICTYKRPDSLKRLLERLAVQETQGRFEFSAVVVDNDRDRSAEPAVAAFRAGSTLAVRYVVEAEPNISVARNQTLAHADGDYVAFIDDDEYPDADWLFHLHETAKRFAADAVIGFVKPEFESEPPAWVRRGWFFFKPAPPLPPTGSALSAGITSNTLVAREAIRTGGLAFDPAFGRTGSEDDKFFRDFLARGFKLVFCAEAIVHETIPVDRQNSAYLWKRHHLQGQNGIRIARLTGTGRTRAVALLKSFVATGVHGLSLPFLLLRGRHLGVHCSLKIAWHLGFIAGALHWRTLKDREQFESYMQPAKLMRDEERT